jgi:hypothetical protein
MLRGVIAIACSFALVACDVVPTVRYHKITAPDFDGLPKFKLQSSIIAIDRKKNEKGEATDEIVVASIPAEAPFGPVIGIQNADAFGISTTLKLTPRDNTRLIQTLGTATTDNRVKYIQDAASIVTGLIGLGVFNTGSKNAGDLAPPAFPAAIDVSTLHLTEGRTSRDKYTVTGKLNGQIAYTIDYGGVPIDAIETANFPFESSQSVLIYSACRDANVKFSADGKAVSATVRVADPNFVETAALPAKGQISFHTACGVSVSAEASDSASTLAIINALIAAAKSVRDAEKAKGKNKTT